MWEELNHWSDWLALGIFGLFVLAAIGHLIQVFTGPHRIRAFFLALITPVMGGIIAMMVGALLHPGGDHRQAGAPSTAAARALPTPEWAKDMLPMVENWAKTYIANAECMAFDWRERHYIHCVSAPYEKNAGQGLDIIFRLKDGALYPVNGTTHDIMSSAKEHHGLPDAPGFRMRQRFVRDGGPMAADIFNEIRRRLHQADQP